MNQFPNTLLSPFWEEIASLVDEYNYVSVMMMYWEAKGDVALSEHYASLRNTFDLRITEKIKEKQ